MALFGYLGCLLRLLLSIQQVTGDRAGTANWKSFPLSTGGLHVELLEGPSEPTYYKGLMATIERAHVL